MLGSTANSLEGLIEWNSVAPSSSRERLQSGANAAFSQGEPLLGRVDSSGSLATGKINDPVLRQEIAKVLAMSKAAEWTARRARTAQEQGRPQGPEGSLGKLASSTIARAAARVHTSLLGPDALLTGDDSPMSGLPAEILVSVPASSIAGGTDEIQRNIISERVLKMPRERTGDTEKPFKDVPRNTVA